MDHNRFTELEQSVLNHLLDGDDRVLAKLRAQLADCRVQKRKMTGVGFFTDLIIPETAPRVEGREDFELGDVCADIDGLKHGAGFVLFVRNGAMDFLEGFSYDEPWPEQIFRKSNSIRVDRGPEFIRGAGPVGVHKGLDA